MGLHRDARGFHHTAMVSSAVLVLLAGCPGGPGGSGGSSSSSSTGSGGTSSSSSSGAAGAPVPMEQLCATLASGYGRYYASQLLGITDPGTMCGVTFTDDELLAFLLGDPAEVRQELCSPDGGAVMAGVASIQRAVQQGRVTYHPDRVGDCVAAGRAMISAHGGIQGVMHQLADAGNAVDTMLEHCARAVEGMQAEGQPCSRDIECAGEFDAGASCMQRSGASCEGTCRRRRLVGEECRTGGFPGCTEDATCLFPGATGHGVCVRNPAANGDCQVDGGALPCPTGYRCATARCLARFPAGTGCTADGDCLEGLSCTGTPSRCTAPPAPVGAGQPCGASSADDVGCTPCLTCFGAGDAGKTCVTPATAGQPCGTVPCAVNTVCSGGTCRALATTGQPCFLDDLSTDDNEDLRGNCLDARQACTGSPATCTHRGGPGATCQGPALPRAVGGSCLGGLVCARASATDTQGTCAGEPGDGQPCGDTPATGATCAGSLSCRFRNDAGVGVCGEGDDVAENGACATTGECARGLYCRRPDAGGIGSCAPGASLGTVCGSSQPTGTACATGYCKNGGRDAGYVSQCAAYEAPGASCSADGDCGPSGTCDSTLRCVARATAGEYCSFDGDCAEGMQCDNNACVVTACAPNTFLRGMDNCADGGWVPVLIGFGAVVVIPPWRRRRRGH